MPEVQEVFRMTTEKVRPDAGFVDRQNEQQRKQERRRKIGAFAVAAAIGLAAVVLLLVNLPGQDTSAPPVDEPSVSTVDPADAEALEVARGYLDAFGALDAEAAMTYLADDADVTGMTEGSGSRACR